MDKRILIIDSDPLFIENMVQILEPLQFEVNSSGSGKEGLTQVEQLQPDLVILSAELDDMNGYMVHKKLRAQSRGKEAKVIITSANQEDATFERHKKLKGRADGYLRKPIPNRVFLREIVSLLDVEVRLKSLSPDDEDPELGVLNSATGPIGKKSVADPYQELSREELVTRLDNQERELEYLRKEVGAFKTFMATTNKMEKELEQSKAALAEKSQRLAQLEKLEEDLAAQEKTEDEVAELNVKIQRLEQTGARRETALEEEVKERKRLDTELSKLQKQFESTRAKLEERDALLTQTREALDDSKDKVHELAAKAEDSESARAELDSHLEKTREKLLRLEQKHEQACSDLEHARLQADDLAAKLKETGAQWKSSEEIHKAQNAGLSAKVQELTKTLDQHKADYETKLKALRHERDSLAEDLEKQEQTLSTQLNQTKTHLKESTERVDTLEAKLKERSGKHTREITEQRNRYEGEIKQARAVQEAELSKLNETYQQTKTRLEKQVEDLEITKKSNHTHITQLEKELADVRDELTRSAETAQQRIGALEEGNQRLKDDVEARTHTVDELQARLEVMEQQTKTLVQEHETERQERERHFQTELAAEKKAREAEIARAGEFETKLEQMLQWKARHENVEREYQKLKLGHETLKSRVEKTRGVLESGLREIQGITEELDLDEE